MYEIGSETGRYYSVNVPFKEGMDDMSYEQVRRNLAGAVESKFLRGCS